MILVAWFLIWAAEASLVADLLFKVTVTLTVAAVVLAVSTVVPLEDAVTAPVEVFTVPFPDTLA